MSKISPWWLRIRQLNLVYEEECCYEARNTLRGLQKREQSQETDVLAQWESQRHPTDIRLWGGHLHVLKLPSSYGHHWHRRAGNGDLLSWWSHRTCERCLCGQLGDCQSHVDIRLWYTRSESWIDTFCMPMPTKLPALCTTLLTHLPITVQCHTRIVSRDTMFQTKMFQTKMWQHTKGQWCIYFVYCRC